MSSFKRFYNSKEVDRIPISAGVLLYSIDEKSQVEIFLVTPGGPKWEGRYSWGIPKGMVEKGEDLQTAAIREFEEETEIKTPAGVEFLHTVTRHGKYPKTIHAFMVKGTGKEKFKGSNKFEMEWPQGSGKIGSFPEIREGKWFKLNKARKVISSSQVAFVDALENILLR